MQRKAAMWFVVIAGMFSAALVQADTLTIDQANAVQESLGALCPLLQEEQFLTLSIAEERKNPAGVIDLSKLHNLGEELALTRHAIKETKISFAAGLKLAKRIIHKAPDAGFCASWLAAQQ